MRPRELPKRRLFQAAAVVFIAASLAVIRLFWPQLRDWRIRPIVQGTLSTSQLGWDGWEAIAARGLHLGVAAALIVCMLVLIPAKRHWFTDLGRYTMYVLILHAYLRYALDYSGIRPFFREGGLLGVATLGLLAFAVTVALSTSPIRRVTSWLVEPKWPWALRTGTPPSTTTDRFAGQAKGS